MTIYKYPDNIADFTMGRVVKRPNGLIGHITGFDIWYNEDATEGEVLIIVKWAGYEYNCSIQPSQLVLV